MLFIDRLRANPLRMAVIAGGNHIKNLGRWMASLIERVEEHFSSGPGTLALGSRIAFAPISDYPE